MTSPTTRCAWLPVSVFLATAVLLPGSAARAQAPAPGASLPAGVHCGRLLRVERVTGSVPWVDLDAALLQEEFSAPADPGPSADRQRAPAAGRCYAVLAFEAAGGRSIGRQDYVLEIDGQRYPCLALRWDDRPFDVRNWQVAGPREAVELLFEVPSEATTARVALDLPLTVPTRDIPALALLPDERPGSDPSSTPVPSGEGDAPEAGTPAEEEPSQAAGTKPVAPAPKAAAAPLAGEDAADKADGPKEPEGTEPKADGKGKAASRWF